MRQVGARYAPICCTAAIQSLRNIGRSISAGFIPPVGVVRATSDAAMVIRGVRIEGCFKLGGGECAGEGLVAFDVDLGLEHGGFLR